MVACPPVSCLFILIPQVGPKLVSRLSLELRLVRNVCLDPVLECEYTNYLLCCALNDVLENIFLCITVAPFFFLPFVNGGKWIEKIV